MPIQATPPIQLDPSMDNGHQLAFINQNFQSIANVLQQNSFVIVKSDTVTVTGSSALAYGTPQTTTIAHNLGYIPAFQVYVNPSSPIVGFQGGTGLTNLPLMYFAAGVMLLLLQARADSTNLYLDIINTNSGTDDLHLYSWAFKYYLMQPTAT